MTGLEERRIRKDVEYGVVEALHGGIPSRLASVARVKLLLDENVSPKVAEELARVDGLDACHVRDRGLLAATDAEVLDRAYDEDRALVTANVADFLKLARARYVHPGIILLEDGALPRADQLRLVQIAAAFVAKLSGAPEGRGYEHDHGPLPSASRINQRVGQYWGI